MTSRFCAIVAGFATVAIGLTVAPLAPTDAIAKPQVRGASRPNVNHAHRPPSGGGHGQPNRPPSGGGGAHRPPPPPHGGGHNNMNVNRNVNVNVNNHGGGCCYHDWDDDWDDHWHPVATMAVAATTAAVIGSIVNSVPPNCSTVIVNGISYSQCGSTWYQPQYVGSSVQYVVVNPPR